MHIFYLCTVNIKISCSMRGAYQPELVLHYSEDVGRADAKQQHTVRRLQSTHHPPSAVRAAADPDGTKPACVGSANNDQTVVTQRRRLDRSRSHARQGAVRQPAASAD